MCSFRDLYAFLRHIACGFCEQDWLLRRSTFHGELFRMLRFPVLPEGLNHFLNDTSNGDGEEASEDTEEFGTGEESKERDDGMKANGLAENARCHDLPQHDLLQENHKDGNDQHSDPALGESGEDNEDGADVAADHGDEEKEKKDDGQQSGELNVQEKEENACTQSSDGCKQQKAAKVAADALIQHVDKQGNRAAIRYRSFVAEPVYNASAIQDKVDAERDNDDERDDIAECTGEQRQQSCDDTLQLSDYLTAELIELVLCNAQILQEGYHGLDLLLSLGTE